MPTATIKTKFVNDPTAEGRSNTVKTADNQIYGFWANKVQLEPGKTYDIEFTEKNVNGKVYKTITKAVLALETAKTNGHANGDGTWQVPNFVSNVVGQAIVAGLIKSPTEIKSWALGAREAGEAVLGLPPKVAPQSGQPHHPELNDEVPF